MLQLPTSLHTLHLLSSPCSFTPANSSIQCAGCCTYGQDGCTTCLRHSLQYSVCAASINVRFFSLLLMFCAGFRSASNTRLSRVRESNGSWLVSTLFTRGVCALRQRYFLTESQYKRRRIKSNKRLIGCILGFGKEIGESGTRSRPVATASRCS